MDKRNFKSKISKQYGLRAKEVDAILKVFGGLLRERLEAKHSITFQELESYFTDSVLGTSVNNAIRRQVQKEQGYRKRVRTRGEFNLDDDDKIEIAKTYVSVIRAELSDKGNTSVPYSGKYSLSENEDSIISASVGGGGGTGV